MTPRAVRGTQPLCPWCRRLFYPMRCIVLASVWTPCETRGCGWRGFVQYYEELGPASEVDGFTPQADRLEPNYKAMVARITAYIPRMNYAEEVWLTQPKLTLALMEAIRSELVSFVPRLARVGFTNRLDGFSSATRFIDVEPSKE